MAESWCNMTIAEMNKAIEDMRKLYQFKDTQTKIRIGDISGSSDVIELVTVTEDETTIIMSKRV